MADAGHTKDDNEDTQVFTPSLDFKNAKALFCLDLSDANDLASNFYQITEDDSVKMINWINSDGLNEYELPYGGEPKLQIKKLIRGYNFLLAGIFYVQYWDEKGNTTYFYGGSMAIKKLDNVYQIFPDKEVYTGYGYNSNENFKWDSVSYYYLNQDMQITNLSLDLTFTEISPAGKSTYEYEVDFWGNIVYKADDKFYFRTKYGSIITLDDNIDLDIWDFWLGSNSKFYLQCYNSSTDEISIVRLEVSETSLQLIDVFTYKEYTLDIFSIPDYQLDFMNLKMFITNKSWVYDQANDTIRFVTDLPEFTSEIVDVDQTMDHFFIATTNNILKVDYSYNKTELLPEGAYEIYSISANHSNEVLFNAIQNSSGKVVIGEIDSEGNIKIIDDTINKKLSYLEYYNLTQ